MVLKIGMKMKYKKCRSLFFGKCGIFWCTRRESNPQPSASEADTLSNCATSAYLIVRRKGDKTSFGKYYNTIGIKML